MIQYQKKFEVTFVKGWEKIGDSINKGLAKVRAKNKLTKADEELVDATVKKAIDKEI